MTETITDPQVIRVRGGDAGGAYKPTDPYGLSKAILHVLKQYPYVKVLSVGKNAHFIAMKAFRLASEEIESLTKGAVLVNRQSEFDTVINNKNTKGICTRIFGIEISDAL